MDTEFSEVGKFTMREIQNKSTCLKIDKKESLFLPITTRCYFICQQKLRNKSGRGEGNEIKSI